LDPRFYGLVVGTLCVWRLTHLISAEDGPFGVIVALRRAAGAGFWGQLLDCFYCLSLWIALPFAVLTGAGPKEQILLWLALSAGSILLDRVAPHAGGPTRAVYFEHAPSEIGGDENALLRSGPGPRIGSPAQPSN
jgi:uncharacterized protein DUF1360